MENLVKVEASDAPLPAEVDLYTAVIDSLSQENNDLKKKLELVNEETMKMRESLHKLQAKSVAAMQAHQDARCAVLRYC